jgi:sigma-B regulation protein RsbU (phosphoserine phosphatase)
MTLRLSPGNLLERANRLFCEFMVPGQYATVICGRADQSGRIELANAGHCLPILHDGKNVTIDNASFPLGLFCESEYTTTAFQLEKGEGLLLYSDGLIEAANADGTDYGEERLLRVLANCHKSPKEVIENCLKDLRDFQLGHPRRDDLTVLSIRRAGTTAAKAA